MKNRLLFVVIAALATIGCRKEPEIDPYIGFKVNATPRWETDLMKELPEENELSPYIFIIDAGGKLFGSAKYKIGRITANDGSDYEIIEFEGPPAVGKPAEPSLRKPLVTIDLHSLEIVKMLDDKLWIVFQETATSPKRMVVQ